MDPVDLQTLADAVGGEIRGQADGIRGVQIDSRRCAEGDLFVALPGGTADGHRFVESLEGHASAAIVERWVDSVLPQCRVLSGRGALGAIARWNRERCTARMIGVTGSNGKTTVKQLLAAILANAGETLATEGNYNNELGVPLTLCRLQRRHVFAVVEMGASARGDIAHLASLARPRIAVVTNAAEAHLEGFGSVRGVALAKGELYTALPSDGVAVLNAVDPHASLWRDLIGDRRVITFGADDGHADVTVGRNGAETVLHLFGAESPLQLYLPGRHNRLNAAAAAATAMAAGASADAIRAGVGAMRPVPGRLQSLTTRSGALLLDDSYNANPLSLTAALEVLGEEPGERWLILGDMAELGAGASDLHARAGRQARAAGVTRLFGCGPLARIAVEAFGEGGEWFDGHARLVDRVSAADRPGLAILVKGSRSAAMDRVVAALRADPADRGSVH